MSYRKMLKTKDRFAKSHIDIPDFSDVAKRGGIYFFYIVSDSILKKHAWLQNATMIRKSMQTSLYVQYTPSPKNYR